MHLRPCPACSRHVADEARCPFCSAPLDPIDAPRVATARLGRAARMAFGAAMVTTASVVACGGGVTTGSGDASADANGDASSSDGSVDGSADASADTIVIPDAPDEAIAKPYGAPPADGMSRFV